MGTCACRDLAGALRPRRVTGAGRDGGTLTMKQKCKERKSRNMDSSGGGGFCNFSCFVRSNV